MLDTSVIIDGRIADICETGFLEGTLVVPQFVLRELQQVADSSDSLKRNRGRRGLDILQKIQKMAGVHVQIVETDFPEVREVDLKLIELARRMSGKIVTNDFNLNKVAQLRGVPVLNINELANSLKPVVLPGELLRVFILKEGKEPGQGVGLPRRRHHGGGGPGQARDRQDHRGRGHQRAADHRRQDDLLPLARRRARRGRARAPRRAPGAATATGGSDRGATAPTACGDRREPLAGPRRHRRRRDRSASSEARAGAGPAGRPRRPRGPRPSAAVPSD